MGSIPRVFAAPSRIEGTGLFAAIAFAQGESILRLDDSRVVCEASPLDPSRGELACHVDYVGGGRLVLAQPPERHINHACEPNVYSRTIGRVRHVVAMKPIRPGDEVTYDYSINSDWDTQWPCTCHLPGCRRIILSFFKLPAELQQGYLPLLDDWFVAEHEEEIRMLRGLLGH
jgi:SET domain-containing protein